MSTKILHCSYVLINLILYGYRFDKVIFWLIKDKKFNLNLGIYCLTITKIFLRLLGNIMLKVVIVCGYS